MPPIYIASCSRNSRLVPVDVDGVKGTNRSSIEFDAASWKAAMHSDLCRADFRKDYQAIGGVIRERFGGVPITALTATATARVQADVKASLGIAGCACFQVDTHHFTQPARTCELDSIDVGLACKRTSSLKMLARPHATRCWPNRLLRSWVSRNALAVSTNSMSI